MPCHSLPEPFARKTVLNECLSQLSRERPRPPPGAGVATYCCPAPPSVGCGFGLAAAAGCGFSWTERLSIAIWPTASCGFKDLDRWSFGVGARPPFFGMIPHLRPRARSSHPMGGP